MTETIWRETKTTLISTTTLHNEEEIHIKKKKKHKKNHPNISSGHRIPMLFKTFFLADFRLKCIIQPAACTAVDKKQNDVN